MAPLLAGLGFACRIHDNPAGADLPILVARRIEPACPPCCCMDTATWCAATRRAGTPAAIPGRCASRATAGTGAAPPTTRASTASTWPRSGHRARGRLGFNAVWLIETGEEAGSPGLAAFCEARRDELAADVFLASDGPRLHAERPTLFMGSRGAVNFELSLRARARLSLGQLGRAAVQPAIVLATPSPRWWTRARITCPACVRRPSRWRWPGPGRAGRGRRRGRSAIDAHWGEPGLSASEKVFGWNSLDVLTFGAGDPASRSTPSARGLCVVPAALRGRHGLARAGNPCARTPAPGRLRQVGIRLGAQAGATGCPRTTPGSAGPRPRSSAAPASGPRCCPTWAARCQRHLRRPAGPAHDLGAPLVPGLRARAQRAPAGRVAREAWPSWPACSGTWATRDRPARRRRAPSTLTPRPRHVHQDPRRRNRPGRRRCGARTPPTRTADQDRRALHAGRRDRSVARLLASKLAGKLGQPVIIENRPGASTVIGAEAVARARPDGYADGVGQHHLFRAARAQDRPALRSAAQLRTHRHRLAGAAGAAGAQDLPASTAGEAAELARKQSGRAN